MAAIDKMNEFYTCLDRFAFLSSAYRPDNIPDDVRRAFDLILMYSQLPEIMLRIEEARDYFNSFDENREKWRMREMTDYLMQKYVRDE